MSLDKAIDHGKEHRLPYRGSRSVSTGCRHRGYCSYCERNRRIAEQRTKALTQLQDTNP